VIDPADSKNAQEAKVLISAGLDALNQETVVPIDVVTGMVALMDIGITPTERLDLDRFFSGQLASLRPLVPLFDAAGNFDTSRFPDPTFGGIRPRPDAGEDRQFPDRRAGVCRVQLGLGLQCLRFW